MLDEWYGQRVKSYLLLKGNTTQFFSFEKRYREINFRGKKKVSNNTLKGIFENPIPSSLSFPTAVSFEQFCQF
jgi:hypothetical protein